MKTLNMVAAAWILVLALVGVAGTLSESPSHARARPSTPTAEVTGLGTAGMLGEDMRMLERMRAAASPSMNEMTAVDPMWVNAEMIRAQEEYQAQIDRMLARR